MFQPSDRTKVFPAPSLSIDWVFSRLFSYHGTGNNDKTTGSMQYYKFWRRIVAFCKSRRFVDLTCAESIPRSWCISWLTVCRVSLIKPSCLLLLSLCRRAVVIRQFVQTSSISWWPRWPPTHWWHRWLLRLLRQPCTYSTLCIHCMHTHFSFEECKLATSHSLLACTRVCKDCDDSFRVLAVL